MKVWTVLPFVLVFTVLMFACNGQPDSDLSPSPPTTSPVAETSPPSSANPLVDKAQIPVIVLEAVQDYRGNLPISAILGIIAQETGGIAYDNSADGVMQVTTGAGTCRSQPEPYEDTVESINRNIQDGICILKNQYMRNEGNLIYAIWKYNGGENPYDTYGKGQGDPEYLAHVASRLVCEPGAWVWRDFGSEYCDKELASHLVKAQELVSNHALPVWPELSCIQGINCPDLSKPVSIISPPKEFKKTSENNRPPGFRSSDSTWWFNAGTWSIPVIDTDPGPASSGLDSTGCYYRIEDAGGRIQTGSRACNSEFKVRVGPPEDDQNDCVTEGLKACTVYVGSRDTAGNESEATPQTRTQFSVDYSPPGAR